MVACMHTFVLFGGSSKRKQKHFLLLLRKAAKLQGDVNLFYGGRRYAIVSFQEPAGPDEPFNRGNSSFRLLLYEMIAQYESETSSLQLLLPPFLLILTFENVEYIIKMEFTSTRSSSTRIVYPRKRTLYNQYNSIDN